MTGVIRIVVLGAIVLLGTGLMSLTRKKGWAEIRALCISVPIAFTAVFCLNWAKIDGLRALWDVLAGALLDIAILWSLIMVAYIGLRRLRAHGDAEQSD